MNHKQVNNLSRCYLSITNKDEKSAQRDANTARALAVVRFAHRPPATNTQTGPITIHCAAS